MKTKEKLKNQKKSIILISLKAIILFILLASCGTLKWYVKPDIVMPLDKNVDVYLFWQYGSIFDHNYFSNERFKKDLTRGYHSNIIINTLQRETPDFYFIGSGEIETKDIEEIIRMARDNGANAVFISGKSYQIDSLVKIEKTLSYNPYSGSRMVMTSYVKDTKYKYYFSFYRIEQLIPEKYRLNEKEREKIEKTLEAQKTFFCEKEGIENQKISDKEVIHFYCLNGKRHGYYVQYYIYEYKGKNMKEITEEGYYKNGKKHGIIREGANTLAYYEGDPVYSLDFKLRINLPFYKTILNCGNQDGENIRSCDVTNFEGLKYTYYCKKGKKEGKLRIYCNKYICNNGKESFNKAFCDYYQGVKDIKNQLCYTVNFENDLENGESQVYDINGALFAIYNYKNGLLNGETKYYENNEIKEKLIFEDGILTLHEKYVSPKITERVIYKEFKPVKKETINN